ncbi:MAG: lipid-A-disaccharide synthase [Candidatus Saganbacteria bacterium]|nr:lipid-A-disaccharide synthase [Candidatus Saganbacteria bacterium]
MRILVSAGEVSGDLYGSFLVKEIKKVRSDVSFFGMGGEKLAAAGMDVRHDIIDRSSVGLIETLPNIIPIYLTFRKMVSYLDKEKPDLVIAIDSQGFNVPFLTEAKKREIKTAYFIPPQEWLWGTDDNLKKVTEIADQIIEIFEDGHKAYKEAGGNTAYFGHPILDIVKTSISKEQFLKKHGLQNEFPVISLGLGSRKQEFNKLLPKILKTAELVAKEYTQTQFLIPIANSKFRKTIEKHLKKYPLKTKIIEDSSYNILNTSDLLITKSGTINIEACVLNVPNIMMYEVSPLTYFIAEKILKIKVPPFFSLPNLIAKENIIPEFVQKNVVPKKMAEECIKILKNPQDLKIRMQKVTAALGSPGATKKIAQAILKTSG